MRLVAHRGFAGAHAENTIPAFEAAATRADAIEFDVRRCGSGELVVVHDETLERIAGVDEPVAALSREELAAVDVLGSGAGVPTLDAVVAAIPSHVDLLVEFKEEDLVVDAIDVLESSGHDVTLQSFDPFVVEEARTVAHSTPRALVFGEDPVANVSRAVELGCVAVTARWTLCVETALVDVAHEHDLDVYAWTIDDRESADRTIEAGVDALIVDHWSVV